MKEYSIGEGMPSVSPLSLHVLPAQGVWAWRRVGPPVLRGRSPLPLGGVVEEVQAAAAGGDHVGHELGAVAAHVPQAAAVGVEVRKLLLHRALGETAH